MKRIMVIGCPGSGKSTFSRELHARTGIPLYHLDRMYWNADKTTVEKEVFRERLAQTVALDEWIIDGNYGSTLEMRMEACDTVVLLDYPTEVCLQGVQARKGKPRPDMPWIEAENETDEEFMDFIRNFTAESRPRIMMLLEKYADKEIHVFKTRAEADAFLQRFGVSDSAQTILASMRQAEEIAFGCEKCVAEEIFTQADIEDAWARLRRFASYVRAAFPETQSTGGMIDSPVQRIDAAKMALERMENRTIRGSLYVKRDDSLAVCGSLKARGGLYTVFKHAEKIAMEHGMLREEDDYAILCTEPYRELFSRYRISVGSTGNLGMSIGLSGKKLGFDVTVYMSEEAKEWKKNKLRAAGVHVHEFQGDYTSALKLARRDAEQDPATYFIDDEDSADLFLGYSAASKTLADQLAAQGIRVDAEHPLIVYLPCGVGGGPGGITFGLKKAFGEHVYCCFGEPTQMPCMALAMAQGRSDVSVYDIGLGNGTVADGLACSSPSRLAYDVMRGMLDGCFTVTDAHALRLTKLLYDTTGIKAEPSSCVALGGVGRMPAVPAAENAVHLVWLTGGSLVPEEEWRKIGVIL